MDDLQARLRYRFEDADLLLTALTHRSWAYEGCGREDYERLEFLGDAILGAVASAWLYERVEGAEGELSKLKGFLVSTPRLADYALEIGVGRVLRLGVGEERSGGREKESLLADAMEAVIGAVFLDTGFESARRVIVPLLEWGTVAHASVSGVTDAKTALQELTQAAGRELPEYVLVGESGPDHQKIFEIEVSLEGDVLARGSGPSKKKAEQAAASEALRLLDDS